MLVILLMICSTPTEAASSAKMKMEECGVQQLPDVTIQSSMSDISCAMQCDTQSHCQLHFFNQSTRECTMASVPDILVINSTGCETNITVHVVAEYVASFESINRFFRLEVNSCFFNKMTNFESHSATTDVQECFVKCRSSTCQMVSFDKGTSSVCQTGRLLMVEDFSFCSSDCADKKQFALVDESEKNNLKSCTGELGELVSEGKTATQSSISFGGVASRAVDGDTNQNYGDGSCSHTANSNDNPWWEVDLANQFYITQLTVYNRGDAVGERLGGFKVLISSSNDGPFSECASGPPTTTNGQIIDLNCHSNGRFVRIFIEGTDKILCLCEVKVYGIQHT